MNQYVHQNIATFCVFISFIHIILSILPSWNENEALKGSAISKKTGANANNAISGSEFKIVIIRTVSNISSNLLVAILSLIRS